MASLNDTLLAHQINTIKHAAGLGQSVIPYLNEMKAIIRKKVAGFDAEKRTAKRLETMLNTLANTLNKPAGAWLAELEKSLKEFAKYEATYQANNANPVSAGLYHIITSNNSTVRIWRGHHYP